MISITNDIKEFLIVIKTALINWDENNLTMMSAALAFYSILSLAPLIIISIAFANFFIGSGSGATTILNYTENLFGKYAVRVVEIVLSWKMPQTESIVATVAGIAVLFFGASRLVSMMQNTLNIIWSAHIRVGKLHHVVKRELRSLIIILSAGALFVVFLVLETMISALRSTFAFEGVTWWVIRHLIGLISQLVIIFVVFAVLNKGLPHTKLQWKQVFPGAILSALLFVLGNKFIAWYLGRNMLASIYGAASAIVIILLWTYYIAQIFLLGVEVNKLLVK